MQVDIFTYSEPLIVAIIIRFFALSVFLKLVIGPTDRERERYGSHIGSLFFTGIKFDSQIFSSVAQDFSSFLQESSSTHRFCSS